MKVISSAFTVSAFMSVCVAFAGCGKPISLISQTEPTLSEIKGQKIFRNTIYTKTDFDKSGSLRELNDFNFLTESAPCTVLGAAYKGGVQNYIVKIASEEFGFSCRAPNYNREDFMFSNAPRGLNGTAGTRLYLQLNNRDASAYIKAVERGRHTASTPMQP